MKAKLQIKYRRQGSQKQLAKYETIRHTTCITFTSNQYIFINIWKTGFLNTVLQED